MVLIYKVGSLAKIRKAFSDIDMTDTTIILG